MNTLPIPSAKSIAWGIGLASAVAPFLFWLAVLARGNGFLTFLAVVAGFAGVGFLIYGAYAFFTSFDAMAARYLGANGPASASAATSSAPTPTYSGTAPASSAPFPTFPRASSRPSTKRGGPTAASLLDGPPPPKPDTAPTAPREAVRIVATPLPPSDDDD